MSEAVNPYQSPGTEAVQDKPLVSQGNLTEPMLLYLKAATPWLRFIGILGFLSAGLTALSCISFFAIIPMMGPRWNAIPGLEVLSGGFGVAFGVTMAIFSIGGGVLIFFPALFIYRFGERIRSYLRMGADQDLELAFKNNKSLWKFTGIICIISLAAIPLLIVATVVIAIVSAFT